MTEWYGALALVALVGLVWATCFVGCSLVVEQGWEDGHSAPVRLTLTYPIADIPIREVEFRLTLQGFGARSVVLRDGTPNLEHDLPEWDVSYYVRRTPQFSPPLIAHRVVADRGVYSVTITDPTHLSWHHGEEIGDWTNVWNVWCDAYEGVNKTGTKYRYYDETRPQFADVDLRGVPLPTVEIAFLLTTRDRVVVQDLFPPERPPVVLRLAYTDVRQVIVQVRFRIKVDDEPERTVVIPAAGDVQQTNFVDPKLTKDAGRHDTPTDSGEWQATIGFPPLGKWQVWCETYKISQGALEVNFPAGDVLARDVTGLDPLTPIRFEFKVNKQTDTIEPA